MYEAHAVFGLVVKTETKNSIGLDEVFEATTYAIAKIEMCNLVSSSRLHFICIA